MNSHTIRELVRAAIIDGRLPRSGGKPRIFGGRGEWQACSCCHEIIQPTEVQYDIDCTLNGSVHTLSMHMKCFQVWELESRALAGIAGHSVCEDAA
jgi:hypothetical protein